LKQLSQPAVEPLVVAWLPKRPPIH
jgi:hypothetical protein